MNSVQLHGSTTQTLTVYAYGSNGSLLTATPHTIAGNGFIAVFLSNTSTRSVVVISQYPIAVTVNNFEAGAGGDEIGSTTPVHR